MKICNSTDTSNDEKNSVIFGSGPKRGATMKRHGACALVNLLGPLLPNSENKKDTGPNSLSLAHLRRVDLSVDL